MTEKLSQFTIATPTPSDYLCGATAGANTRFSVMDIGLPPAQSNQTFYVSTTGSDSNPGTMAQPFATLQNAWNVALSYNYQFLYTFTIQIEDGTYTIATAILVGAINFASPNNLGGIPTIQGNLSSPGNVVLDNTVANLKGITISCSPANNVVFVGGFQINSGGTSILCDSGEIVLTGDLWFGGSVASISIGAIGGAFDCLRHTLDFTNVTSNTLQQIINIGGLPPSVGSFRATTFKFPASFVVQNQFVLITTFAFVIFESNTYTNGATLSTESASISDFSILGTDNGVGTDLPGSNVIDGDFTCLVIDENSGAFGVPAVQMSGTPTTSDLPATTWGVFKDTSGGGVYVAYNDAGTIKKVALT